MDEDEKAAAEAGDFGIWMRTESLRGSGARPGEDVMGALASLESAPLTGSLNDMFEKNLREGQEIRLRFEPPQRTMEDLGYAMARALSEVAGKPPVLLTPLPRRIRVRLAVTSRIDRTGTWCTRHGMTPVAIVLWKFAGLWGR